MGNIFGTLTRVMPLVIGLIGAVEKIFGSGHGQEKKEAYLEGIMAALGVVEGITDKDMINNEEFRKLLGNVADSVVAVNNFIRDYKTKQVAEDK